MATFLGDARTAAYFERPAYIEQKYLWCFHLTGELLECEAHCVDYKPQNGKTRGTISTFSKRSRLRLLKFISSVDWRRIGSGLFLTLTYPDGQAAASPELRTRQKYLFHRRMENHLGREIGFLWRLEWKQRKTGARVGEILPHWHMIIPNVAYIDKEKIREWWRDSIHATGFVSTSVERLTDKRKHQVYISKYAAKMPDQSVLDCVPYSHIRGRHWGFNKRDLIPMETTVRFENVPYEIVEKVRRLAYRTLRPEQIAPHVGFSSFGHFGDKIKAYALKLLLDAGCVAC